MKLKILIGIFVLAIVGTVYYFIPKKLSDEKIKIKCNYMANACGDCYPQYRVKEILAGNNEEVNKVIDTELTIEFESKEMEQNLDKNTAKCVICYDFVFTGALKHSVSKGTYFVAEAVDYKLKNDSCCK